MRRYFLSGSVPSFYDGRCPAARHAQQSRLFSHPPARRPAKCNRAFATTSAAAAAVGGTMHLNALRGICTSRHALTRLIFPLVLDKIAVATRLRPMTSGSAVPATANRTAIVTLQNKRTGTSARGNGDRRQRDCGLRGSQNDAQRYARTQRHDVSHFLTVAVLARILIGARETARDGGVSKKKKKGRPRAEPEYAPRARSGAFSRSFVRARTRCDR